MPDPYRQLTLRDHLRELRGRFVWSLATLLFFSLLAYYYRARLSAFVFDPIDQPLYYTAPSGGFNFIIKLCVTTGFICTIPIGFYHALKFFEPILPESLKRHLIYYFLSSLLLVGVGLIFAYWIIIPAALRFLQTFNSQDIQALISVEEYLSFILIYLVGFAIIFQLPIVLLFVNSYKNFSVLDLASKLPIVVLSSFIIAAIVTPTPDPVNQSLMALPIVSLYGFSILLIALVNQPSRRRQSVE